VTIQDCLRVIRGAAGDRRAVAAGGQRVISLHGEAIGLGLIGLRLVAGFYLSTSIAQHVHQYGP
jgi:hypothetical protein